MSKLDKLTSMQNQVFANMLVNPDISEHFSSSLKSSILKVGIMAVLSTSLGMSTMAHADNNNGLRAMLGISAVSGLLVHNSKVEGLPPECNVRGISGVTVGGATAAGSYVGSRFGKGNGKTAWTVGLGALSGVTALGVEGHRINQATDECYRRIAEREARNNPQYASPSYAPNPQGPTSTVLYSFNSVNYRGQTFVTMENSPGMNALKGMRDGNLDPQSNGEVSNAIDKALQGLHNAYVDFQASSDRYMDVVRGNSQSSRSARYAVSDYELRQGQQMLNNNKKNIQNATKEWDNAFNRYARERAFATAIFDNAAIDGYSLSRYNNALTLFTPPQNASVACECILPNRFSTVPVTVTSGR